jgi:hypothetical protein
MKRGLISRERKPSGREGERYIEREREKERRKKREKDQRSYSFLLEAEKVARLGQSR